MLIVAIDYERIVEADVDLLTDAGWEYVAMRFPENDLMLVIDVVRK